MINTKVIHSSIQPCLFHFALEMSFEMFPKESGFATISEPFVLNIIIHVPLTNK